MRMKPSYRKHYFKLADERNCTKSLEAGEVFTSGSKKSNDIGSESCSVNVFEDGTILEDENGETAGRSPRNDADLSHPLDEAVFGEEEETDEVVEFVEEGGKEENYYEEEELVVKRRADLPDEKNRDEGVEDLEKDEDHIKEEDFERQGPDPLDVEMSSVFIGEESPESDLDHLDDQVMESLPFNVAGEKIEIDKIEIRKIEIKKTAEEEVSARELTDATLSIVNPERGRRIKFSLFKFLFKICVEKFQNKNVGGSTGGGVADDEEGSMEVSTLTLPTLEEDSATLGETPTLELPMEEKEEGDLQRGVIGDGGDGAVVDDERRQSATFAKDTKVADGNVEFKGHSRGEFGDLASVLIKDEVDVEDTIILSDPEFDLQDQDGTGGKGCEQDDEIEKPLKKKPLQRSNKASVFGKRKRKESENSLKNVLGKQWRSSGNEKLDGEMNEKSRNFERHGEEDNDLQSLIKYLVTKKRPDKETIKKIVTLTRTKLEEMEVDTELSEGETKVERETSKARWSISKGDPRRVISNKSASELKDKIIQTMKRNAEEREIEVKRAGKVSRERDLDEDHFKKEHVGRRREEAEVRIREGSMEKHKKRRTEQLLRTGKVTMRCICLCSRA